jgi:hypothetical protein
MFLTWNKNPFTRTSKIKVLNRFCLVLFILTILLAVSLVSAGCSSGRNVELGVNNRDTITSDDPSEGEDLGGGASSVWWYHTYTLDVEEGYPYEFTLTSIDGNTMGIWSEDKGSWIVEVSPSVSTRTATYRFESGGNQKLWVEAAEIPSEYVLYVTR